MHEVVNSSPTEEAVRVAVLRACYRGLLLREPEPAAVDPAMPPLFSPAFEQALADITQTFASSAEFAKRRGEVKFPADTWVQMLIEDRIRLWIDLGDAGVSRWCLTGSFEPVETKFVLGLLKPGMSFVDIGANIGWFTVQAADRVGPQGHVTAFEPRPTTGHWLKRSIEDNAFSERAEIYNCAVGPRAGEIHIGYSRDTDNPGGTWSLLNEKLEARFRTGNAVMIRVPMVALDEVVGDRRVDVIKIDIEGAEPAAMAGSSRILSTNRPIVVSEINPALLEQVSNVSARDYVKTMNALGYRCCELTPHGPGAEYSGAALPNGLDMINVAFYPII